MYEYACHVNKHDKHDINKAYIHNMSMRNLTSSKAGQHTQQRNHFPGSNFQRKCGICGIQFALNGPLVNTFKTVYIAEQTEV